MERHIGREAHPGKRRPGSAGAAPLLAKPPAKPRTRKEEVKLFGQLMTAIKKLDLEGVRKAALAGAKLDAKDGRGRTPLSLANEREINLMTEGWRVSRLLDDLSLHTLGVFEEVTLPPPMPSACNGCEKLRAAADDYKPRFSHYYDTDRYDSVGTPEARGPHEASVRLKAIDGELKALFGIERFLKQHGAKE